MSLQLGAVFKVDWFEAPVRVLAFDAAEVIYDAWWPGVSAWGLAKLGGTFSYLRVPRRFFEKTATFLRIEEYTQEEAEVHRPDLPLSFARNHFLSWYSESSNNRSPMAASPTVAEDSMARLNAGAIYLVPFGPKHGSKPSLLVRPADGASFTSLEVIRLAWQVQVAHLGSKQLTEGVGIYRSGVRRRVPSYYIWGSTSRLEQQTGET